MTTTIPKTKIWCSPVDLHEAHAALFRKTLYLPGTQPQDTFSSIEVEDRKAIYNEAMIQSIRAEMKKISEYIPIPYIVFLANAEGCVLDLICSSDKLEAEMLQAGLCPGVNLGKSVSGLNAVSLSMEMNCMSIVRGKNIPIQPLKNGIVYARLYSWMVAYRAMWISPLAWSSRSSLPSRSYSN
ncbi:hypothetical protein [Paenibacillus pedocola]|uniref:hypothetical protein n=1 Tax=Paenibacillus pedocola TaxID=3242193 RepID=UPI00287743AE|nr:hypothetical protein [Paenibacillus typhae]